MVVWDNRNKAKKGEYNLKLILPKIPVTWRTSPICWFRKKMAVELLFCCPCFLDLMKPFLLLKLDLTELWMEGIPQQMQLDGGIMRALSQNSFYAPVSKPFNLRLFKSIKVNGLSHYPPTIILKFCKCVSFFLQNKQLNKQTMKNYTADIFTSLYY